ncbi:hypothetical protein EHQ12_12405 [Leptospira gomenensis]|uniref:Lipoprotein n=1 Tax=Leptospira gomenensis TaxID=2484974 RepID=A0A5F1YAT0_9LEPT|nr:hypothetical protein [Leptospira gomenensis]TGK32735.1 hypothetical protein EHQ17_12250 [Leptospira gomenensis]TGK36882.1 hypothetical protein EHQ12_12405 [Leptospira gomenensis]TGK44354.1 hypothetical protein EHQ07_11720 [Leptospira gomenensis]TGK58847.1 hypothetical protein EHQ13_13540 [Leptospira gomenensis]
MKRISFAAILLFASLLVAYSFCLFPMQACSCEPRKADNILSTFALMSPDSFADTLSCQDVNSSSCVEFTELEYTYGSLYCRSQGLRETARPCPSQNEIAICKDLSGDIKISLYSDGAHPYNDATAQTQCDLLELDYVKK